MASTLSSANKAHYEALAAILAKGPLTREEQIEWNDIHWTALTAELAPRSCPSPLPS
jgi:hypothetical protein